MTEELKRHLRNNGSEEHVEEFGDCIGIVEGPMYDSWIELNVRWQPSNLRYGYHPKNLERA